jgi:manganese transport protein
MNSLRAATLDGRVRTEGRPRLLSFLGPATLVAVGYMDPGNWATDLDGGARFGYRLLWVLVASNWIALLLQTLATRLGVVTGLDLAQACKAAYSKQATVCLWILAELAIIACDLAEVVGSAIALNLLFGIPILLGTIVTVVDVFLILALQSRGMRTLETIVIVLIATIAACFVGEMWIVQPHVADIVAGLVPKLSRESLYLAIGIVGATIMPHNLYLHSSTVKSRPVARTVVARKRALRFFLVDTTVALHVALCVNGAILVLSAAVFGANHITVSDLRDAHQLLTPLLGSTVAAALFAIALLAAGQSSTITGALAGQIVMTGFVDLRISPLARRLVTRSLALIPAVSIVAIYGDSGLLPLLIASQVALSLQLPFAIVPLIRITASSNWMGPFANGQLLKWSAAACAALIIGLNILLVCNTLSDVGGANPVVAVLLACLLAVSLAFLVYIAAVRLKPAPASVDAPRPPVE